MRMRRAKANRGDGANAHRSGRNVPKERQSLKQFTYGFALPVILMLCLTWAFYFRYELSHKARGLSGRIRLLFHRPLSGKRLITVEELSGYDGSSEDRDIYLAIRGEVFDVTRGRIYYGKGGPYAHFAGRDASRAFATGCFKEHLTHDLRGLDQKQLSAIDRWVEFFDRKKSYKHVGRLVLPDIDPNSEAPSMCKDPVFVFGP